MQAPGVMDVQLLARLSNLAYKKDAETVIAEAPGEVTVFDREGTQGRCQLSAYRGEVWAESEADAPGHSGTRHLRPSQEGAGA